MSFTWSPLLVGGRLLLGAGGGGATIVDDGTNYHYNSARPVPVNPYLARAQRLWQDDSLPEQVTVADSPPGATADAMATGNVSTKWVAAIEGYQYLLTDATTTAAVTAWTNSNHSAALGGLYVRPSLSQSINPWDPFENDGGSLTLQVVQSDTADTFGVDTHLKSGGVETLLTATVDSDDTTLTVKSTSGFTGPGTVYAGTEAVSYTSVSATTFVSCTRGQYAPFDRAPGTRFGHSHEITTSNISAISLLPVVSSTPRTWIGKWVGLWRHLHNAEDGSLSTKDDALCTFAGRITEIRDNPTTMTTDVECEHVLAYAKRHVMGDDMWSATIKPGISLAAPTETGTGYRFEIKERTLIGGAWREALPLVVVSGTPANAYEIKAGRYSIGELCEKISAWLSKALTDGPFTSTVRFSVSGTAWNAPRTQIRVTTPGSGVQEIRIVVPHYVYMAFGEFAGADQQSGSAYHPWMIRIIQLTSTTERYSSIKPPLANTGGTFGITAESGTFWPQSADLPQKIRDLAIPDVLVAYPSAEMALCMITGVTGNSDSARDTVTCFILKSGTDIVQCTPFNPRTGQAKHPPHIEISLDDGDVRIQQYFHFVDTFADLMKRLFLSTGTAGYNHATYDDLPPAIGMSIPYDILGAGFLASLDQLPQASQEVSLIVTKPTKFEDALGGALKLRFAFLRWINGGLQFWSWMTPTTGDLLEEANKASPAGNADEQRSATVLDDSWARNVIKVEYDRDFTLNDSGGAGAFHSHVTILDRVAIDDAGGKKTVETVSDRSSYSESAFGGSGGVEALIPYFRSIAPMFTRPVRRTKRTIDPRFFEGYSVGDCVLVTDAFARDPDTGIRGVSVRPGIIIKHSYESGGFTPDGSVDDMHGEVEILFLDVLRIGPYVPCADVNSGAANGGLDAGTLTIFTVSTNNYSSSADGDAVDSSYMSAGRKIRIIERDPEDPAGDTLMWDRVVESITTSTITVTVAIGSPAWDSTKFYRIVWDTYGDAVAAQQVYSYQADDADAKIEDARAPYEYTTNTTLKNFSLNPADANGADDEVELVPNNTAGDGIGLDVGHHTAINRLINNLIDYKTARSNPILTRDVLQAPNGDSHTNYELVMAVPIFLSEDGLSSSAHRYLYVAPHFKSSDGTSVDARITLARRAPGDGPSTGSVWHSVDLGSNYGSVTFSTTSTSYTTPTAQAIDIGTIKDSGGVAWLVLELRAGVTFTAYSYGIATCYEGPRV